VKLENIRHRQPDRRQIFFDGFDTFDAEGINRDWRKKLFSQVNEAIDEISLDLTDEVIVHVESINDKISELLWGLDKEKIKENIIFRSSKINRSRARMTIDNLKDKINHGFQTLFLRFSRPVAEVLVQAPVNTGYRDNIRKKINIDIHLLDPYYDSREEQPAYKKLGSWVQHGRKLLHDSKTRKEVLGLREEGKQEQWEPPVPETVEDIVEEVEADLKALEVYLEHAVFHAAGFEAYRLQELGQINNAFREARSYCQSVMVDKYHERNPHLLSASDFPKELMPRENNIEVSERLKQLRESIEQAEKVRFESLPN
jgi:hypothetical protein